MTNRKGLFAKCRFLLATLCLALIASKCYAQTPLKLSQLNHTSWTAREGAPSDIQGLVQAPDGALWIGAGAGLFRFDGISFTPFQPAHGEPVLPGMSVGTLSIAHNGTIWAGFKPTGVVAIQNGHIHVYGTGDGLPAAVPKQLLEGPGGTMWAVIEKHLYRLANNHWQMESADNLPASDRVYKTFFDRAGVQWVGTNQRIYRRPPGAARFEPTSEPGGLVWQFAESPRGELWLAVVDEALTHASVRRLDVEGHRSNVAASSDVDAEDMLFDASGTLWISAEHGLWTLRAANGTQNPNDHDVTGDVVSDRYDHQHGLTSDNTISILEDTSGDIWVGTIRGLDRFKQPKFIYPDGGATSDAGMILTSCDNGDVWLGLPRLPLIRVRNGQASPQKTIASQIYSMHCGHSGLLYFTDEKGVNIFDGANSRSIGLPAGLPPFSAKQVIEMPDRTLLAPFRNGAGFWRWSAGTWSQIPTQGMPTGTALVIYLDRHQRLWSGFAKDRIGMLDGSTSSSFHGPGIGDITAFAETSHGFLAGGVNGLALFRNNHFEALRLRDELHIRGISGIAETKDGDLWLNGAYGVIHISAAEIGKAVQSGAYEVESELITEGDVSGPAPLTYSIPTTVHGPSDTVWFSSSNAAFYIDPAEFPRNPKAPLLSVLSVAADGEPAPADLRVRAGVNTLVIHYAGINLAAPERVSYRYRLEGSDRDWQNVGRRTEAIYTRLRPGRYIFHVVASNGEGIWSAPTTLRFTILPAFYQTFWFIALSALLVVGAIWSAIMVRLRRASETARIRAEERAEERVRIARDLHDTLLQSVQGLLLQFQVAAETFPTEGKPRKVLERALSSADTVLAEGRDRVKDLRTSGLQGASLAEALEAVGEQTIQGDRPTFRVSVQGAVMELDPTVLEELFCIGREAITNAFNHADANIIDVTIVYARKTLTLTFADDGRGMDAQTLADFSRAGHWGLVGMKERASRIEARLHCESTPERGTTLTISLPAARAYRDSRGRHRWLTAWRR
jgi:signal transduction histidine kinase/ligand-binding sensor domain-containing protein